MNYILICKFKLLSLFRNTKMFMSTMTAVLEQPIGIRRCD